MRKKLVVALMALWVAAPASAEVSIGIGFPNVSIGINLPIYPRMERVPGHPVYYAPGLSLNFFFYDGLYWVFQDDDWYASSWYNGPWERIGPNYVPLYLLRVPVRYYRHPPGYFRDWKRNAPPRWEERWGHEWSRERSGWERWDRRSMPAPAPLPSYQRKYSGDRYPDLDQQRALQGRNYRYEPRDPAVRQKYEAPRMQPPPTERRPEGRSEPRGQRYEPREVERASPPPPAHRDEPAPPRAQPRQRSPELMAPPPMEQRPRQPPPGQREEGAGPPQRDGAQPGQGRGQEKKRDREDDRDRGQDQERGR
jgi:hypothetical protein